MSWFMNTEMCTPFRVSRSHENAAISTSLSSEARKSLCDGDQEDQRNDQSAG